jgi:hypothetical protein
MRSDSWVHDDRKVHMTIAGEAPPRVDPRVLDSHFVHSTNRLGRHSDDPWRVWFTADDVHLTRPSDHLDHSSIIRARIASYCSVLTWCSVQIRFADSCRATACSIASRVTPGTLRHNPREPDAFPYPTTMPHLGRSPGSCLAVSGSLFQGRDLVSGLAGNSVMPEATPGTAAIALGE